MLGRVIFCVVIAAAVLAVVLLATVSPVPHRSAGHDKSSPPAAPGTGSGSTRSITVYIHPATASAPVPGTQQQGDAHGEQRRQQAASALVFRHRMTAGSEVTSRTVGAASGFALPAGERGRGHGHSSAATMMSAFDTVHLAFDGATAGMYSGSICVQAAAAAGSGGKGGEENMLLLRVVGGTGAFAFAPGHAVLRGAARGKRSPAASPLRLELSVASAG